MKVADLQFHNTKKDKYKEGILIGFYKRLPSDQYALKEVCLRIRFRFWYDMKGLSKMKDTKSCN